MSRRMATMRVLLIGFGAGSVSVLALLRGLPRRSEATVLLRPCVPGDVALRREIAAEVSHRGGHLMELGGQRHWLRLDAPALRALVPDLHCRHVYVCGPDTLSRRVASELCLAGVAER